MVGAKSDLQRLNKQFIFCWPKNDIKTLTLFLRISKVVAEAHEIVVQSARNDRRKLRS